MREISAGAGQGNNNAAQHHFGTREGIIEAGLVSAWVHLLDGS